MQKVIEILPGAIQFVEGIRIDKAIVGTHNDSIFFTHNTIAAFQTNRLTIAFLVVVRYKLKAERFKSKTLVYLTIVGTAIGWLINPQDRQVEIYRSGQQVEVLQSPLTLSGEDVLPGFVLNLESIW